MLQARQVRDICETIACDAICSADTCLVLLPLASEYSCPRLMERCMQVFLQKRLSPPLRQKEDDRTHQNPTFVRTSPWPCYHLNEVKWAEVSLVDLT